MKKTHKKNRKLMLASMVALLPIAATGATVSVVKNYNANAATSSAVSTTKSYVKEVSVTNSNFNSSSSSYSLSTSLSGWTGQLSSRKTTAGIINTGSSFSNYMSGTFYLAKNPEAIGSDKHVLMINSKTDNTNLYSLAKQGYKTSSSISLSANSYYSFQVSFKGDTNYETETKYPQTGEIGFETDSYYEITSETFSAEGKSFDVEGEVVYLPFPYNGKTYYLAKQLNMTEDEKIIVKAQNDVEIFYEDENFVGFLNTNEDDTKTPVYVLKAEIDEGAAEDNKINITKDTTAYTCDIEFIPDENSNTKGKFRVPAHTPYFTTKTDYNPVNAETKGSIYLSGLTDEDGNDVKAEYVSVSAKEWQTFYFFVATGNETQNVNLELWLGSKNTMSSGVVFFDDVHVNQYSPNAFWKTYQNYYNKSYNVSYGDRTKTQNCTSLINLKGEENPTYQDYNLDFEKGIYNQGNSSIKDWSKDENCTGNAQIFDVNDASGFKSRTGYNSVGTNYGCQVEFDEETEAPRLKVSVLQENKYVLGLWTNNNYAKVTSKDIDIESKKIYRISAEYKISELKSGNVYLSVKENDHTLERYNLTKEDYTLAEEASSTGLSTNTDNDFTNDYGTIEFYVKGGSLIDSSVNISLSLGSSTEASTGCVVFDNVKIEAASAEDYDSATNKVQLGSTTSENDVPNGEFDEVVYSTDADGLYTPDDWTITKGDGFVFGGVVNTDQSQYSKYRALYEQERQTVTDRNNKYFWSTWQTRNKYNKFEPDNVLMLANMSKSWQKVRSGEISISANTAYKLSFKYKTFDYDTTTSFKVSVFGKDGFKLFESEDLSSTTSSGTSSAWKDYSIYLNSFPGSSSVYLEIDLGTSTNFMQGVAFLDGFNLKSNLAETDIPEDASVIDMSDFCLNLPINEFDTHVKTGPAYTGTQTNGTNGEGGIVTGFSKGSHYEVKDADNEKFFFLRNNGVGSYTLQSNFSIDLESGSYYELSFKLKTYFNHLNDGVELDPNKKYNYGVTFGLTGFEYMTGLRSNEEYTTYKMYINATDSTSVQLYMAIVCDSIETGGSMAIYDVQLNDSTEDEYNAAKKTADGKNYDVNKDNVFVSKAQDTSDTETDTDTDTDTSTDTGNGNGFNWLLIPTLITALAIVIAIVGYFLRKVKIKKIEIKRKETYDRKRSANVDAIKRKALAERDAEVSTLKTTKAKFEQELESLEGKHKKKVIELREQDKGSVSKVTDKEFKMFAKKRTVIAEKIEALNRQIEEANTPEHLLSLERKAFVEDDRKRRELEKQSKKEHKEQEKTSAQTKEKNAKEKTSSNAKAKTTNKKTKK